MIKAPMLGMRALIDPAVCFHKEDIDKIVHGVELEEAALRDTAGAPPLTDEDCVKLRQMVLFRICAEAPPAGNA